MLKAIIAIHFARIFADYAEFQLQANQVIEAYALGSVANYNFFESYGLCQKDNDKLILPLADSLINPVESLAGVLEYLAHEGKAADTGTFFRRYNNSKNLRSLNKALRKIFPPPASEEV